MLVTVRRHSDATYTAPMDLGGPCEQLIRAVNAVRCTAMVGCVWRHTAKSNVSHLRVACGIWRLQVARKRVALAKSVEDEITDSVDRYHWWWRWWNTTAMTMALLAIISSFVASIIAATKNNGDQIVLAIIAGLPALILTIDRSLKSRERADWFWSLVLRYQEVERALTRKDIESEEASRRIDDIERMADATDPTKASSPDDYFGPRVSSPNNSAQNGGVNKYCGQCGRSLRDTDGQ